MPAKSAKQERLMQAVANNPKFAKEVGIPQSVGKEYIGKARGGSMKLCSACKSPAKCKAAGKCLAKKAKMGGAMKYKAGGSFPDLTGDGKVTKADVLKGRGVKTAKQGGVMKYSKAGKVRGAGKAMKGTRPCKMR